MLAEGSSFSDEAWISCSMEVLGFSSGQFCFMPIVWVAGRMCFGSCRHGVMLQEEWVEGAVPGILWALMAVKPE